MIQTPKISIVIPCYNEEDYIKGCLDAVMRQTVSPYEVIVVDNNCTDKTAKIAKSYDFVHVFKEKRKGIFYSRQTAMNKASGDIVCRIDADTQIDKDWVKRAAQIFADESVMAASGPMGYHDFLFTRFSRAVVHVFLVGARLLGYTFLFGCNMAIRKSAWGIVEPELCNDIKSFEDMDIATHLERHGLKIVYDKHLKATASIRRAEDNPIEFFDYITRYSYTAEKHHKPILPARYAEVSFLIGYGLSKIILMFYDTKQKRFTRSKLRDKSLKRLNPMLTDHD